MHSIGFKVFLSYWVAVMFVIIAANAMGPDSLRRPELIKDAVVSSMRIGGQAAIAAYERGGCTEITHVFPNSDRDFTLATAEGQVLCGAQWTHASSELAQNVASSGKLLSRRHQKHQLVALPLNSLTSNKLYVFASRAPYSSRLQLFGWFPGPTIWLTSLLSSIVLTIILTRPLRKLRKAARALASGDMTARVQWHGLARPDALSRRDEMQALMRDFNHMAACLQSLVESQRMLLRDVSHELRSPLARLNVALELAREDHEAGSTTQHLNRIQREADRLHNLIAQLLSLSALQQPNKIVSPSRPVQLNQVLQELADDAQFEANARKCAVTLHSLPSDLFVQGHEPLLRGAIENVVRNAIQYSGEGGHVEIDLSFDDKNEASYAVISVRDDGPGIPDEELRKIFRPFYRVDESRQRSTGGFGIGLAIVERSIRLHSGKIVATNRAEGGLTVAIYLPLGASAHSNEISISNC